MTRSTAQTACRGPAVNAGKAIARWLLTTRLFAFLRRILSKLITSAIVTKHGCIVFYNDPERSTVMDLIRQIRSEVDLRIEDNEAYQIFMAVKRTSKFDGDIAEIGSYKGGSAKIICEAKGNRTVHIFDTFEGLPTLSPLDDAIQFEKGQFTATEEEVRTYLSRYTNVFIYKGLFPATAEPIRDRKFSFVSLDVDLYESTVASLDWFYSRMSRGGVIMSHDYINSVGVRKAFDEFFGDKPEPIIEMSGTQCLVIKM